MFKPFLIIFLLQLVFSKEASRQRKILVPDSRRPIPMGRISRVIFGKKEYQEKTLTEMKLKWQEIFKTDDLNNDGVITLDDRDRRIQVFIDIYTKYLRKTLRDSFDCAYFKFGRNESFIAIADYLNGMENAFKKDSEHFRNHIRKCYELYAPVIDVNGDSRITWQEYKTFEDQAYHTKTVSIINDFVSLNPRLSAEDFADDININGDSKITWMEYKHFHSKKSEIGTKELKDFLDLNPHVSVEEFIDAWTTFETDDKGRNDQV